MMTEEEEEEEKKEADAVGTTRTSFSSAQLQIAPEPSDKEFLTQIVVTRRALERL